VSSWGCCVGLCGVAVSTATKCCCRLVTTLLPVLHHHHHQIVVLANGEQKSVTEIKYEPNVVDVASDGSRVVVGSENKMKVHTFLLNDDFTLTKNKATDPSSTWVCRRLLVHAGD